MVKPTKTASEEFNFVFNNLYDFLGTVMNAAVCQISRYDKRRFANVMVNNIRRQAYLIHLLLQGTDAGSGKRIIECQSLQSICRTAFETYAMFHQIYVAPEKDEEKEFLYHAWILATLLQRDSKYDINKFMHLSDSVEGKMALDKAKSVKEALPRQKTEIRDLLSKNSFYIETKKKNDVRKIQKLNSYIQNGLNAKRFDEILENAGLKFFVSREVYSWLSTATHPTFHIMEICAEATTYEAQLEISYSAKSITLLLLARLCLEYPVIFPAAQSVLESNSLLKKIAEEITSRTEAE